MKKCSVAICTEGIIDHAQYKYMTVLPSTNQSLHAARLKNSPKDVQTVFF